MKKVMISKPKEDTFPYHDRTVEKQFFTPCDYQLELLSYAFDHNTIVSLSSEAGKTFLAVLLIKEFAYRLTVKKEKAIIVADDEMTNEYAEHIHNHSSLRVGVFTNTINCSKTVKEYVEQYDVLIVSPSFLVNLLNMNCYKLSMAALLIVDKCHMALAKNSAQHEIMKFYRQLPKEVAPRVLGISNTILNDSCKLWELEKAVERLEDVMCSRLKSINDLVSVIKYNANPTQFVVKCADPDYTKFEAIKIHLKNLSDLLEELMKKSDRQTEYEKSSTMPCKTVRDAIVAVTHSFQQLGVWCAWKTCQVYGRRITNVLEVEGPRLDRIEKRLLITAGTFLYEFNGELGKLMGDAKTAEQLKPYMDSRLVRLLETLAAYHFNKPNRPHVDPLRALVFVRERFAAYCINALLKHLADTDKENYGFINSNFAVGNAGKLAATKDESSASHQQNAVLQRFRHQSSGINLLVTTSVLEEGIALPHCNLVVRYDPPDGFRSFVQSRGRANSPGASYFLLTYSKDCHEFEKVLNRYLQMQEFITKYINLDNIPMSWEDLKKMDIDAIIPPFIVPESGARVTAFNAIECINKYCAKLPSDIFTRLTPQIKTFRLEDGFGAEIAFPINSFFKKVIVADESYTSKKLAITAVAVKAVKMLYEAGELDKDLQPLMKTISLETIAKDRTTNKKRLYHKRKVSRHITKTLATVGEPCYLYAIEMDLVNPFELTNLKHRRLINPKTIESAFGFLTTKVLPTIPEFPVYQRQGDVFVHFYLCPGMIKITDEQRVLIEKFHNEVFSNVLDLKANVAFAPLLSQMQLLVVPLKKKDMNKDLREYILDESILQAATKFDPMTPPPEETRRKFEFRKADFEERVVVPWYRNKDIMYFYVGKVREDQTPLSEFPDNKFDNFIKYFENKYKLQIYNESQNLLDVDHTSSRKNLLLPRSTPKRSMKRVLDNQRQLLVPELVSVHYLNASYFEMSTALPTIFYRLNALLLADELREIIVAEALAPTVDYNPSYFNENNATKGEVHWDALTYENAVNAIRNVEKKKIDSCDPAKKKGITNGDFVDESSKNKTSFYISASKSVMFNSEDEMNKSDTNGVKSVNEKQRKGKMTSAKSHGTAKIVNGKMEFLNKTRVNGEMEFLNKTRVNGEMEFVYKTRVNGKMEFENQRSSDTVNWSILYSSNSVKFAVTKESLAKVYLNDYFHIGVWNPDDARVFSGNYVILNNKKTPSSKSRRSGLKRIRAGGLLADESVAETRAIGYTSALSAEAEMSDDEDTDYDILMDAKDSMHVKLAHLGETIFADELHDEATGWDDYVIPEAIIEEEADHNAFNMPVSGNQNEIDVSTLMQDLHKNYDKIQQAYHKQAAIIESSNPDVLANAVKAASNGGIAYMQDGNFVDLTEYAKDEIDVSEKPTPPQDVQLTFGKDDMMIFSRVEKSEEPNLTAEERDVEEQRKSPMDYDVELFCDNVRLPTFEVWADQPDNEFSFDHDYYDRMKHGVTPALLLQALTTASAGDGINLERLETIGDSFLKMATTNYLYHTFPNENEGLLSYRRSKNVSNVRLSALGIKHGIVQVMETMRFDANNNWLPPCYVTTFVDEAVNASEETLSQTNGKADANKNGEKPPESNWGEEHADQTSVVRTDHVEGVESYNLNAASGGASDGAPIPACNPFTQQSISNKAVADSVEALIGAHLTLGPTGALKFMKWIGIDVLLMDDCISNPPCYDCDMSEAQQLYVFYKQFEFAKLEETIKYKFRYKSYLLQAFTHASYSKNRLTGCYQRLEFLGDAVLDYLITRYFFEYKKKEFSPGVLTDMRSALVNNTLFASMVVHYGFHKHFMALCPGLFNMIEKFANLCNTKYYKAYVNFDDNLSIPVNEEDAETEEDVEVPKALGDIFESLAGAVYLDCGMKLDVVWKVFYGLMKETIEACCENPPKSPIRELFELKDCRIQFTKLERIIESGKVRVTVNVNNATYTGMGRSYRIAKCTAARKALEDLKKNAQVKDSEAKK